MARSASSIHVSCEYATSMRRLNRLSPAAMHPTPSGRRRSRMAPLSLTPADLVRSERSQGRAPGRERRIWPEISEARARLFADDRAAAKPAPTLTPVVEHEDSGWQGKRADHQIAPPPTASHPPAPGDYAPGGDRRCRTRELAPEHPQRPGKLSYSQLFPEGSTSSSQACNSREAQCHDLRLDCVYFLPLGVRPNPRGRCLDGRR